MNKQKKINFLQLHSIKGKADIKRGQQGKKMFVLKERKAVSILVINCKTSSSSFIADENNQYNSFHFCDATSS